MKQLIEYIEEGLLAGMEDTLKQGDEITEDMFKLHWEYAYLNNLPNKNDKAIVGGMRGIYRKYFNRSVPELFTDRHSTLETLLKKPERKHKLNKLDTDGDYIASYLLQCEFDNLVNSYDFVSNKSYIEYLTEKITKHMHKILNDDGKKSLRFVIKQYFRGGRLPILSIAMETIHDSDFKPNVPRFSKEIMCFNFTKGQYYYK